MVQYWKKGDSARAKVTKGEDGATRMHIEGEKYEYPGFPRGHILTKSLAKVKKKIKQKFFNTVFDELKSMDDEAGYDMVPPENMVPPVRELYRALDELENAEVIPDMKGRIRLIKKVITFFLQEDDAYRMRWQWIMERINMKKVKLTKADKYYFRGKYFKVDHDKLDY